MDRLHVATLNIRNLADRWPERLPLLLADMAALQPDLLGLQEVVYLMHQDRLIGAAGEGRYARVRGWAGRPEYGNSLLVREPLAAGEVDRLDLGLNRSAHRASVRLPGGSLVLVVVTHLHHEVDGRAERDDQARQLLDWLEATDPAAVTRRGRATSTPIPTSRPARPMVAAGYRSAYAEANGAEPAVTWPSGIQAPGHGHRRRPGLPRLHLGVGRRAGRRRPARVRSAASGRSDALPERPLRDLRAPRDRGSAPPRRPMTTAGALRLAHRGDWRRAAENTLAGVPGRAGRAGLRRPRVRCSVGGGRRAGGLSRRDARPRPGPARAGRRAAIGGARRPRGADAGGRCSRLAGRRAFLDVELKDDPGPALDRGARRRSRTRAAQRGRSRRSIAARSSGSRRRASAWPRWLNASSSTTRSSPRRWSSAAAASPSSGARSTRRAVALARDRPGSRWRPGPSGGGPRSIASPGSASWPSAWRVPALDG